MSRPLSLQLWSLRDLTKSDFADTMLKVAEIGYTGVETAGFGNLDAHGAATALRTAGLRCSGMHVDFDTLRAEPAKCANDARLLGTDHVICPWWPPEQYSSGLACQRIGEELAAIGAQLRAHGIRFGFHNHSAELAVVDGRCVLDWILDAAAPRDLGCQADVYWIHVGGRDPATFLREQGRRIRTLHLKDEAEIGSGPVRFPDIFAAVDQIGAVEWYVVEVENCSTSPLEGVRRSFAQLKAWGLS
jgi:sugar phosphate isomerase/epimerase